MPKKRPKTQRSQPANQPRKSPSGQPEWEKMGENGRESEKNNAISHNRKPDSTSQSPGNANPATLAGRLTFRQQSALPAIAAAPTIAQAIRDSGVAESTLYRWLDDQNFQNELTRIRNENAAQARQGLQTLMLRSVAVLAQAMEEPDATIRLRAARYTLSFAVQVAEAEKLKEEIQTLQEAQQHLTQAQNP